MIKMLDLVGPRSIFAMLGLTCLAILLGSLELTKWLHLEPCPLCIFQRLLYILVAVFALMAATFPRTTLATGGLAFLSAAGGLATAAYQSWIQFFPTDYAKCNIGIPTNPIEKLVDRLGEINPALFYAWGECTSREWVFLGLSLANWSAVVFMGISVTVGTLVWRFWRLRA